MQKTPKISLYVQRRVFSAKFSYSMFAADKRQVFSFWSSFDVKKPEKPLVFFMKKTNIKCWNKPGFDDVIITLHFGQQNSVTRKGYDNRYYVGPIWATIHIPKRFLTRTLLVFHPLICFDTGLKQPFSLPLTMQKNDRRSLR